MPIDAFTISSNNYLGMTRVFADSYLEHHPGSRVFVCLVDRLDDRVPYDELPFEIILAEDLGIPDFRNFAFRYDILELNTAVKPFVFRYLRDSVGLDRVFYFDPDILVHDRLERLEEALSGHQAVVTPHLTEPIDNRCRPPERVIGMCGVYNLGFLGLQLNDGTHEFLDWWCDRLHRFCIVDLANGLFVDQSWMGFAPAYLDSVAVVRDPIFNIAYWNLPHRRPVPADDHWEVNGRRVGFFHFSGVDLDNLDIISRHQDRVDLWSRPELRPLFEDYRDLVNQSGQNELRGIPYSYGTFADSDIAIPRVSRIALQETDPRGLRWPDPFAMDTDDSFLTWLVEPIELRGQTVNRTALYVWQERSDVKKEFPNLEGGELPRFLEWYRSKGIIEESFHGVFAEALGAVAAMGSAHPQIRRIQEVARIDLSNPGERTAWLSEPIDDIAEPTLTLLSLALHRACPDVAAQYPDPLGRHRIQFAYWFALEGRRSFGLHSDLVAPVRRSLPVKSRISLWFKDFMGPRGGTPRRIDLPERANGFGSPTGDDSASAPALGPRPLQEPSRFVRSSPPIGVNLVGHFEAHESAWSFAPVIRDALRLSEIPHAAVSMDHDFPDQMIIDRIRSHDGAPFPVTVLALPPERWHGVLERLPVGCRHGSRVIGYCSELIEPSDIGHVIAVDEVWAPTSELALILSEIMHIPIRTVPSGVEHSPPSADGESIDLDKDRFWFMTVGGDRSEEDRRAISAAIECVRKLHRDGDKNIGLCLAVGARGHDIARQVRHLPVHVVCDPITRTIVHRLAQSCDGYLDLRRTARQDPSQLIASSYGVPVISSWTSRFFAGATSGDSISRRSEGGCLDIETAVNEMRATAETSVSGKNRRPSGQNRDRTCATIEHATAKWRDELSRLVQGRIVPAGRAS